MANDDKQLTNADLRDAFWQGCAYREANGPHVTAVAEALRRWPDPRPTVKYEGVPYRLSDDGGAIEVLMDDGGPPSWWARVYPVDKFRALASLLPREPVTVTHAMKETARTAFARVAYDDRCMSGQELWSNHLHAVDAALEAVAADLAGKGER
jgi:hypothetical protein